MPIANLLNYLKTLKENYDSLSRAYRRGDFEDEVQFKVVEGRLRQTLHIFNKAEQSEPFREAAVKLFEQSTRHEEYKEEQGLPDDVKEQLAEYKLRSQALSYEVSDYFLTADDEMSSHFSRLAREVSKDARGFYRKHYSFVRTPRVKVDIVKQMVLGALCGVNALYRRYDAANFAAGVRHVDRLILFLERDYPDFCDRRTTSFGLLGLAFFLKGRLLLGGAQYAEADDCFRLSGECYLRKLTHRVGTSEGVEAGDGAATNALPGLEPGAAVVPVSELLAMRRAALALAFGSGYTALISSRVKEANKLLTLARGILHFNAPKVHAYYTELLYWSTKRAEHSNDRRVLEEAKGRVEECRKVFQEQVPSSHYPCRANIELGLVLHYLAQLNPAEKPNYYRDAVRNLEAAVRFAAGDGTGRRRNKQLLAEASYILSHILRYQSADLLHSDAEESAAVLRSSFRYASAAEEVAEHLPRHRCEAILALCGIYAEVIRRGTPLPEVDPKCGPGDSPGELLTSKAHEALRLNEGTNQRISAICYLRLVDYYLKNPNTYSRAYAYWAEWTKLESSVEHAFVKDWAGRSEAELNRIRERSLTLDFEKERDIEALREDLNVSFARHEISEWARKVHPEYELAGEKIVKRRIEGARGVPAKLETGLEDFLMKTLKVRRGRVRDLVKRYQLLTQAQELIRDYITKK